MYRNLNIFRSYSTSWESVIGVEIHAQIKTTTKLFSNAPNSFASLPNTLVSLMDCSYPGSLPSLNTRCVSLAIKTGIALNCKVNKKSYFERKHYFFPDLPSGYQITQQSIPLLINGHLTITMPDYEKTIRIQQIKLEQDSGKTLSDIDRDLSMIDLNRAGTGLMEIVTEPDLSSSNEVAIFIKNVIGILQTVGSCDCNMDQGSLRCDVNVSVKRKGGKDGTRCEIKNLNSIKFITKAIEFEVQRQIKIIEENEIVTQETRFYDASKDITYFLRSKENFVDYKYFFEPDLLPLEISENEINSLKNRLPELPQLKRERFILQYKLNNFEANLLVEDNFYSNFFEQCLGLKRCPTKIANW
eukprot:TRINITY_DN485_c0_g1_i18.p1 TRINITY_DN485_c0_g1~~TRINITY_DN485_c0_g1_i18.p1  ORF type:complete len:357 (+),score=45.29 TRINITY_DN485_c0_g1_i18:1048-2118(+)